MVTQAIIVVKFPTVSGTAVSRVGIAKLGTLGMGGQIIFT